MQRRLVDTLDPLFGFLCRRTPKDASLVVASHEDATFVLRGSGPRGDGICWRPQTWVCLLLLQPDKGSFRVSNACMQTPHKHMHALAPAHAHTHTHTHTRTRTFADFNSSPILGCSSICRSSFSERMASTFSRGKNPGSRKLRQLSHRVRLVTSKTDDACLNSQRNHPDKQKV